MIRQALLCALAAVAMIGCTSTSMEYAGAKFTRSCFASKVNIGSLSVTTTNGTKLELKSYANDQAEALAAATAAAVSAAVKSAKP